jgi:hypothetical protein
MDHFYRTNTENDLVTLHYVAFIEPMTIFLMEALSFDSEQFTSNSINKAIEAETTNPFLLLKEHFDTTVLLYKKSMEFNLNPYRMKF